jgi:pSer/pThr/pTyr-binding forkhead associated (FHA) protein
MKTLYLIGRESDCDIVLWDDSNEISRHHAQIRIDQKGKLWLMDTSLNGTYVNGERILTNTEVEVTTKDIVSFAGIETLDWKKIPVKTSKIRWLVFSLILLVLVGIFLSILLVLNNKEKNIDTVNMVNDTIVSELGNNITELDSVAEKKHTSPTPNHREEQTKVKKQKDSKLTPAEKILREIEKNKRIQQEQKNSGQTTTQDKSSVQKDSIAQQEIIDPIY